MGRVLLCSEHLYCSMQCTMQLYSNDSLKLCLLVAMFRPPCRLARPKKYWGVTQEHGGMVIPRMLKWGHWYSCMNPQVAEKFARVWNVPIDRIVHRKGICAQGVSAKQSFTSSGTSMPQEHPAKVLRALLFQQTLLLKLTYQAGSPINI